MYVLSLTDENNFNLVIVGGVLYCCANLVEKMHMFCQQYVCVITSLSFHYLPLGIQFTYIKFVHNFNQREYNKMCMHHTQLHISPLYFY